MKDILKELGFEDKSGIFLPTLNEFRKICTNFQNGWYDTEGAKVDMYGDYIDQILIIEMFIACDEDGNVIPKPNIRVMNEYYSGGGNVLKDKINQYHHSKKLIIFKDWSYHKKGLDKWLWNGGVQQLVLPLKYKTIEGAINDGVKLYVNVSIKD